MARQTLCVVDMQYLFKTSRKCLPQVVREVKRFKKNNLPIIVLEYRDHYDNFGHETMEEITSILEGYSNVEYVHKYRDGGGDVFIEAGKRRRFPVCNVRMVGVNRSYCVYQTARELKLQYGNRCKIEVVKRATNCSEPTFGLQRLNNLKVDLV